MNRLASKEESTPLSSTNKAAGDDGLLASPARALALAVLAVAVGLVVLAVTLSVAVDDSGVWIDATAAAGMVAMVVAAAVMLGTAQGWANGRRMSLAAASTAVVGLGAVALVIVTYVGGAGDADSIAAVVLTSTSDEGSALTQQVSNNEIQPPGYAHDIGRQPTAIEFLDMDNATVLRNVPGGTVLPNEVDLLREELRGARGFALENDTVAKARAAGYNNTTNDVPFMGAHFLNNEYLFDGVFDPAKPEGLLFSRMGVEDGDWQLVGVWYLLLPGQAGATVETPPDGFAGSLDLWHSHFGLCTRAGVISENNSAESCREDRGSFIGDLRWMMHAWVYPETGAENSDGVFAYLNADLFEIQSDTVSGEPLGGAPVDES